MPNFEITSYKTEDLPNGFSVWIDAIKGPPNIHKLVAESVKLGHRLSEEGKDIINVHLTEEYSIERNQNEIKVTAKIKFRLKKDRESEVAQLKTEIDHLRRAYVRPDDIRAQLENANAEIKRLTKNATQP